MPIRIQQYATPPRKIQVNGIDPGFQQALVHHVGQDAAASTAQAMFDAGKQLTEVGIKEYVSQETARVSQALQDYKTQLSAEHERYSKENQGQKALGAGKHFDSFARETAAPLAEQFSGKFRTMFMQDAAATGLRFTEQGQAYASQQEKTWKKSAWDGDFATSLKDVADNVDEPGYVRTAVQNLKKRYMDLFPGMDYRAVEAELNQKFAGTTIDAFLAKENVGKARAYLGEYKDILGAAAPQYEHRINSMGRELQARARADAERVRTETAISSVQDILSSTAGLPVEERRASVFERIGTVQDIRTRMSMFHMAEGELAFQKTKMDSAINAQAMDIVQQTKEMGPLERNKFFVDNKTPEAVIDATQRLMSRDKTPPVIMSEARNMYNNGKSIDEIRAKLGASFSSDGWAEFKDYTQSKELQTANRKATAFWDEMVLKSGLNVNSRGADEEDKLYLAQKKAEFEDMVSNNEFKSRDDQKAWIYGTLAKRTKPGMIWDSHYTPREAQGKTGLTLPMPPHERNEITRALVAQARPVTEENIQKMYNEKLQERGW